MFNIQLLVSLFSIVLVFSDAAKLPDFFDKCFQSDPNLNECIKNNGNKAIPLIADGLNQHRLPSLRPLKVPFMSVNVDANLGFNISNVEISGLDIMHMDKTEIDLQKKNMKFVFTIPKMEVIGDYIISGRILILPINGNGPMNTTFVNSVAEFSFDYDIEERNGKGYLVPKNSKYIYTHNERVYYRLENLFNGNKLLAEEMNRFLYENWREVNGEIGGRLGDATGLLLTGILRGFLSKVPFDEMFLK